MFFFCKIEIEDVKGKSPRSFSFFPLSLFPSILNVKKTKMDNSDDQTVRSIALAALPADAASIISRIGGEVRGFDFFLRNAARLFFCYFF